MRKRRLLLSTFVVLGLTHWMGAAVTRAADSTAGQTVAGKVVDKEGKAVASAPVRLIKASDLPGGGGRGRRGAGDGAGAGGTTGGTTGGNAGAATGEHKRPTPAAEGTTDADGAFKLANVPAGDYVVVTNVEGQGRGMARVKVVAGKDPEPVTLKLGEAARGGRRGGAGTNGEQPGGGTK